MSVLFDIPARLHEWSSQELHRRSVLRRLPGPAGHPVLGNLRDLPVDSFVSTISRWAKRYGPVYRCRLLHRPLVVISDPAQIQDLLRRRPREVRRISDFERILGKFDVGGVFAAEGDDWRRQRRLVMSAFGASKASDMHGAIAKVSERLLSVWAKDAGRSRNVLPDLMRFTADVMTLVAFGYDLDSIEQPAELHEHVMTVFMGIARRVLAPLPYWKFIPSRRERAVGHAIRSLQATVGTILAGGDQAMEGTLLQRLREARLEDGTRRGMSDQELFSNVMAILFAGEDTTANTLAWVFYFMATVPGVQDRMREEADAVLGDSDHVRDHKQAQALHYTAAVFQESLRLHPVVPMLLLEGNEDLTVGEHCIPAGVAICAILKTAGMAPEHFADPTRFDPERWLEPKSNDHGFRPFGAGPRMCPGRALAMLEAQTLIGTFLRRFVVEPAPGATEPREVMDFTAGPDRVDVRLRVRT